MTEKFEPNTLRSEHLSEPKEPIIACIGTGASYLNEKRKSEFNMKADDKETLFVDFRGDEQNLAELHIASHEEQSYMISSLDGKNKRSEEYVNCTGVAAVGREKISGENISFLSHQCPKWFLLSDKNKEIFLSGLEKILSEIKERCQKGTIDTVIFGGNYVAGDSMNSEYTKQRYIESIETLSKAITDVLGFQPVVITEPKPFSGEDDVIFETNTRRLFLRRPQKNATAKDTIRSESFLPEDIQKKRSEWDKK
jgi:hypothetical protein